MLSGKQNTSADKNKSGKPDIHILARIIATQEMISDLTALVFQNIIPSR